ncbi:MAG: TonB C-terminal domain-containing protein [Thermodesulfobacteriota bacterium]
MKEYLILIFALGLALAMHLLFLGLLTGRPGLGQDKKLLHLEIYSQLQGEHKSGPVLTEGKGASSQVRTGARQDKDSKRQEQILFRGRPAPGTVLTRELEDPGLQAALKSVKERISSGWQKARPPDKGRVEVRLVLSSQGEIISLWVLKLEGSPALADFVQELLQSIAPFPGLENLQKGQMTIDCAFRVQQG